MRRSALAPPALTRAGALTMLCCALRVAPVEAQRPAAPADSSFTVGDALDVVTYTAADLSDDGRWLVATSTTRRDGLGVHYYRDGDPTYIRPANLRVWIIDTQTGSTQSL